MPIIFLSALMFVFFSSTAFTQERLDGVVAVIGNEIILQSELDAYSLLRMEGMGINRDSSDISQLRKNFLDELIDGKVLLAYAKKDTTLNVTEPEVDQMLNNHISMLLKQNNLTLSNLMLNFNGSRDLLSINSSLKPVKPLKNSSTNRKSSNPTSLPSRSAAKM